MCEWGTTVEMEVFVSAEVSHTGEDRMKKVGIDACIAPLVKALNDAGITTVASCCGHGKTPPTIALASTEPPHAERWIVILSREEMERVINEYGVDIHGDPLPEPDDG